MNLQSRPDQPAAWGPVQSVARVGRLARKELSEILRDRRTVITLLLMPMLLYPLLSFAFLQFLPVLQFNALSQSRDLVVAVPRGQKQLVEAVLFKVHEPLLEQAAFIVGTSWNPKPLATGTTVGLNYRLQYLAHEPRIMLPPRYMLGQVGGNQDPMTVIIEETDDLHNAFGSEHVDVVLQATVVPGKRPRDPPSYDWEVVYLIQSVRAKLAVDYLQQFVAVANARTVQAELDRRQARLNATPVRIVRKAIAPETSESPGLSLTAVVPLILILMTITGAVYPAIDLTAGERERGTLEILVSAPVPRMTLLLGKYIAVLTVAVLTATINLTMMLVTLEYNQLTKEVFGQTAITVALVIQLFILLLLFAAFFSAVLLALTSFARSFKEAQAYLIPLMLASLGPGLLGMVPGLKLEGPLTVTPLVNIVLLARDLAEGQASKSVSVVVVLSTLIYAMTAIAVAARIFGAEAVLYSDQSGWSDLFRRPAETRATSTVAGALFCLALTFPAIFVAQSWMPRIDVDYRLPYLILATILLFAGFPLTACALARIRPATALQLRMPPLAALPAAFLLAAAAVPVIYHVIAWMIEWHWTFLTTEQMTQMRLYEGSMRQMPMAVAVGTAALIGIAEEVFFRGFLFSALRVRASQRMTIFASALLFGLFHFVTNFDRLIPSTLMGLLLGWVCWQARSVWPCMLLHATFNGLLTVLPYSQREGASQRQIHDLPLWWQWAALPAFLAGAWLLYKYRARPIDPPIVSTELAADCKLDQNAVR